MPDAELRCLSPRNARRLAWVAATLSAASGATPPASAQIDRVQHGSGAESGRVVAVTRFRVTVERGEKSTAVPVNELVSVRFGGEPAEVTRAKSQAINGDHKAALDALQQVDPAEVSNPLVEADIEFYRAYCEAHLALRGGAPVADAGRDLNDFINAYPQSHHYLAANELLGDLLAATGRHEQAERFYARLARAPWPDYKARAGVRIGRAMQAQDKHAEAIRTFETSMRLASDAPKGQSQRQAAQLGKAVSLAATGKVTEGIDSVQQVLNGADPNEHGLLAQAYAALGACHLHAGAQRDALYAYLHVDLLFAAQAGPHAEALYHLASLWGEVGNSGKARDARRRLQETYPASSWAKRL